MAEVRISAAASVLGGALYIIGGNTGLNALSSVERLNPSRGAWEAVAPLPGPCNRPAAASCRGKLYVTGEGSDGARTRLMLRLDPEIGVWESVQPMSSGRPPASLAAADDRLCVLGGSEAPENSAIDVESLDPDDAWCLTEAAFKRRCSAFARGVL